MKTSKQLEKLQKLGQKLLGQGKLRRIFGLLFALILAIKLLAACNSSVTLSFVVPQREAEYWQSLISEFEQKNPHIRIDLANLRDTNPLNPEGSDEVKASYISAFEGKSPPYDLIYMDLIWLPEFVEKGWVLNLDDKFSQAELKQDFLPSEVDNGLYQGKLYRIPFRTDVGVLYYRKDLLAAVKEQPPQTFDDLIRISQKVQQQKDIPYGYLWQGRRTEGLAAMFVEVLRGYGGFWINDNKQVGLNQPEAIKAVEFLRNTIVQGISPKGVTTHQQEDTRRLFREGEAVFMRNWPNVWVDVNSAKSAVTGKVGIQPMVHATGKTSGGCQGGWGFGIATSAKNKSQAAVQAIKFFTNAASIRQFTLAYASVPSRPKLFYEPRIVAKYSHFPELLSLIEKSVRRPRLAEYAPASCILQKYLGSAIAGSITPQQAMNAAAQETEELLTTGKFNCKI